MLYGWEGNHRSGIALAMRHRLSCIPTYGLSGPWQWAWTMAPLPSVHTRQVTVADFSLFQKWLLQSGLHCPILHVTLLEKLACLDLPNCVYNWLVHYFSAHLHCTNFRDCISTIENIIALFKGLLSDRCRMLYLAPVTPGNVFCMYANDTCLIMSTPEPLKSITLSLGLEPITLL